MNRKAQTIQGFLMIFIVAILGLTLFLTVSQYAGSATDSVVAGGAYSPNLTVTVPAASTSVDISGTQDLLSTPIVGNATENWIIGGGNYTIAEGVSTSTGLKTVIYTSTADVDAGLVGTDVNVSMEYGPQGYINSSGGRAVALLIPIFMALGIAVVVLVPSFREGILSKLK